MVPSLSDAELVRHLPSPLASLYRRSCGVSTAREAHRLAVAAWDAAIKLLAAVAWAAAAKNPQGIERGQSLAQLPPTRGGGQWLPLLFDCDTLLPGGAAMLSAGQPLTGLGDGRLVELYLALYAVLHAGAANVDTHEPDFGVVGLRELLGRLDEYIRRDQQDADDQLLGRISALLWSGLLTLFAQVNVLRGRCFVTISRLKFEPSNTWRIERLGLHGETPEALEPLVLADPDVLKLPKPNGFYVEGVFPDAEHGEPPFRSVAPLLTVLPGEAEILFFHGRNGPDQVEYWSYLRNRVVTPAETQEAQSERPSHLIQPVPASLGDAADDFFAEEEFAFVEPDESEPNPPPRIDESVQFTVYRPHAVRPNLWYPLFAFAHPAQRLPGQTDPMAEVRRQAAQPPGSRVIPLQDARSANARTLPEPDELTLVPSAPGLEFSPPRLGMRFSESVHRVEFRLRASQDLEGQTAQGKVTVFLGALIVAEVPLTLSVNSRQMALPEAPPTEPVHASPYRRIFVCYSHQDESIVERLDALVPALGSEYLREVTHLRSGQTWNDGLGGLIEQAEIFQLFWSSAAMRSPLVRREWQHALSLRRPNLIRPTFWESPLPRDPLEQLPPPALLEIGFQRIGSAELVTTDSGAPDVASTSSNAPPEESVAAAENEASARAVSATDRAAPRLGSRWLLALIVFLIVAAVVLLFVYGNPPTW